MSFQQIQGCFSPVGVSLEVVTVLWAEKIRRGERHLCNLHRHRLQRAFHSTQRYFRISQEISRSFCERLWEKCDGSEYISTSSWFIVNAAELSAVTFQLLSFFLGFSQIKPAVESTFTSAFFLRTVTIFCGYLLPVSPFWLFQTLFF